MDLPVNYNGFVLLLTNSCQKDEPKIIKEKVTGCVQKGPFVNGTSILMSEVNSSLQQTGNIFTTQILNNSGTFEISNISLTSSYVEFSANGYYFDEVKGNKSISQLNLSILLRRNNSRSMKPKPQSTPYRGLYAHVYSV